MEVGVGGVDMGQVLPPYRPTRGSAETRTGPSLAEAVSSCWVGRTIEPGPFW